MPIKINKKELALIKAVSKQTIPYNKNISR